MTISAIIALIMGNAKAVIAGLIALVGGFFMLNYRRRGKQRDRLEREVATYKAKERTAKEARAIREEVARKVEEALNAGGPGVADKLNNLPK